MSRELAFLKLDHGAPYFEVHSNAFRSVIDAMCSRGQVTRYTEAEFCVQSDGSITKSEQNHKVFKFKGIPGMYKVADALLSEADAQVHYGSLIKVISTTENNLWNLKDKREIDYGDFEILCVASCTVAHPRWSSTFGGTAPLIAAAEQMKIPNQNFQKALKNIAEIKAEPVTALLMAFTGELASAWLSLQWRMLDVSRFSDVISRIHIKDLTETSDSVSNVGVVIHSTVSFGRKVVGVFGKTSTAARLGGAKHDEDSEQQIISDMWTEMKILLKEYKSIDSIPMNSASYGPHLHRWGAAFPGPTLLKQELACIEDLHLIFVGDYIESQSIPASIECAFLSASHGARRIAEVFSSKT
uniref:Amine oxidase domain-containing protein n=1 Tax=Timspurckia oligopyrenoides TaxID=708627 RepID=A0A7S1EQH0_9RHOD|mmetsp:Transcript_12160/g.21977  ORF Transcript_12160/g.21977 Transcript_12160/m.21977 type:complete len:356 (+) Transcript_12160:142-1209(+)|eukprot:CAMPEP_0182443130 /NCGR_PEP_ID=MMETSP1172-20130603/1938_1 /TAXON_ID=708627 /ORGANISM="Timspurckia oligopyrenoides, Strain CCMP3278" /LENGTH=355 /DNA_ID=CAMNT_0024638297 /DNA_START=57 /DNA_END=1124 /DNA_ORIENTATION=+